MIRNILFFTILLSACAPLPQQGKTFSEAQAIQTEALEIGKKFGSEDSGSFINGILDNIYNSIAGEGKSFE